MTDETSATWIEDDEKYAFVGLSVKFEGNLPSGGVTANLSVVADTKFNMPANWRVSGCR